MSKTRNASSLTTAVLEGSYYGKNLPMVVNQIVEVTIKRYAKIQEQEEFVNFISEFYEQIAHLITRYEFYGIPFEHYLMRFMKMNYVRHSHTQKRNNRYMRTFMRIERRTMHVDQEREEHDMLKTMLQVMDIRRRPLNATQKKWLLIVSLKFSYWLTHTHILGIATLAEYDSEQLLLIVETIRIQLTEKSARQLSHTERRNRLYGDMMRKYCDISQACWEHTPYSSVDADKIDYVRERIAYYNDRIDHILLAPTNKTVGNMLNIPKGTVDSILYTVKNKYLEWHTHTQSQYHPPV